MLQPSLRFRLLASLLLGGAASFAGAAAAQDGPFPFLNQQPTAPINDGDPAEALARYLRVLGDRPNDVSALTGAARAALACGDPTSAIGFWARADKLQPNNAATKAGLASALVQAEQPKLALKLFDQATALGEPESAIAADRGLARDLRGDNRAAQKDYQLALRGGNDPETVRRYALSLAMSGDRAGALAALDPLLRKQDMGAWRARAFVLALTGDTAGAVVDAHRVLAKPQADQIAPFLVRLASLTPEQQAAAVHFGDMPAGGVRPPTTTVDLARAAETAPVGQAARVELAQRTVAPTLPTRTPVVVQRPTGAVDFAGRPLVRPAATTPPLVGSAPSTSTLNSAALLASRSGATLPRSAVATPQIVSLRPAAQVVPTSPPANPPAAAPQLATTSILPPASTPVVRQAEPTPAPVQTPPPRLALASVADAPGVTAPAAPAAATPLPQPRPTEIATNTLGAEALADGARLPATSIATPVVTATREPVVEPVEPVTRPVVRPTPPQLEAASTHSEPAPARTTPRSTQLANAGAARNGRAQATQDYGAEEAAPTKPKTKASPAAAKSDDVDAASSKKAKAKALADAKAAAVKAAADKQARADKLAADKQAKADKLAKAQEKAAPSRIWVQVAGGANRNDLGKAWDKLKKAAPDLYAGQKPSTTPLRFTNRLLVGPFKDEDAAQAYVNRLTKSGQSGFMFKSSGGQKVESVGPK